MSETMLAARYDRTGPADEVLRIEEVPRPQPGPGEVRVRLAVAGVNPTDVKSRSRAPAAPVDPPQVPGQDGAGTIDAVGEGVDDSRVGERVWVYFAARERPWGTAAQWTVVPHEQAVALPEGASFDLGASLGIPAITAHRCLFADGAIDGRTVLVAGGAGAVGHAAIELGRRAGARVVATVSNAEKAALAEQAGAHAVVNYREDGAAQRIAEAAPGGIDRVVEVALAANLELDTEVCAPHAVVTTYAADDQTPQLDVRRLMGPNLLLRFVLVYTMPVPALHAAVAGVSEAVVAGALTTLPLLRFDLEHTADAHRAVEAGAVGKVLIDLP
ncbi:MAG: NADPH:quinone reductase [Solirubrobacteraceae bacterium]|nr:NADPH:quinone reductase [Solirubrobacteraceae bacterium]